MHKHDTARLPAPLLSRAVEHSSFSPDLPDGLSVFFWHGRLDTARHVLQAARRDIDDANVRRHLEQALAAVESACRLLAYQCWQARS